MEPQVIAAIVSGMFALLGGLVTFFVKTYYEQRQLLPIGSARKEALCGVWSGKVTQPTMGIYEVDMSLVIKGHKILGKASLRHIEKNILISLEIEGGFLYENFLKIEYKNADSATIQFGSMVFEVSPDARKMKGKFAGYGHYSREVVGGDIFMEKSGS